MSAHPTAAVRRTGRDKEPPAVLFAACGGEFLEVEHFAERHAYCGRVSRALEFIIFDVGKYAIKKTRKGGGKCKKFLVW
jgi:hypothetical protein